MQTCVALHNFLVIRRGLGRQDLADAAEGYMPITTPPHALEDATPQSAALSASSWRDSIANAMHEQYKDYLEHMAEFDAQDVSENLQDDTAINSILETDDIGTEFRAAAGFF